MDQALWSLYLRLQTEYALGTDPGEREALEVVTAYLTRIRAQRPALAGSLLIGPGHKGEVATLRECLPAPVTVLTAHAPEAERLGGTWDDVQVDCGDIHDMPYRFGRFAFVYASNVLEHCFAPYIALLECRRVLAPDGLAYFVLPSFAGQEGGRGAFHLHCLTQEVWVELLRKTGFGLVDVEIERGGEDPTAHYVHYRCAATAPPHPHDELLATLTSEQAIRGRCQ